MARTTRTTSTSRTRTVTRTSTTSRRPVANLRARQSAARRKFDLNGFATTAGSRFGHWLGSVYRGQSKEFNLLVGVTVILVGFGVLMVLSASYIDALKSGADAYSVFFKQAAAALIGLLAMSVLSKTSMTWVQSKSQLFFFAAMGLQFLVLAIGTSVNGNRNWLNLGPLSIQPSEILKLAMILQIAALLSRRGHLLDVPTATWYPALGLGAISMVPVMLGGDLGTVIIMFMILFFMLGISGLPRRIFTTLIIAAAVITPLLVNASSSRRARIMAWLNPDAPDPNDVNWQASHGLWALAAGGFGGVGLGESKMKWSWIPEVENDFIFAIVGEELGFLGAMALIAMFIMFAAALIRIILKTDDMYKRYLVTGVLVWITMQATVNIAVVLNLLPVLGVPLPFISAGGSSLAMVLAAVGIVLAVERQNPKTNVAARRSQPKAARRR